MAGVIRPCLSVLAAVGAMGSTGCQQRAREVEIVVKDRAKSSVTINRDAKGSPEAILKFFDTPPLCTPADVDALLQAIKEGRQPTNYQGVFDQDQDS